MSFPTNSGDALEAEVQELYGWYAPALSRYAATMMHTPEVAQDAVQEVFLRYFVERNYGRGIENPRAWLFRVLRNYLLDSLKTSESKQDVVPQNMELLVDDSDDPEAQFGQSQVAQRLVGNLSVRERETLALRSQGLSYEEIAQALGLATGTVGALLARAYRKLRDSLAAESSSGSPRMAEAVRVVLLSEDNG